MGRCADSHSNKMSGKISEMTQLNCQTPGCKGTREISKTAPNRSRIKELCKPCLAAYTKAYQRKWYAKHIHGKTQKKRGGPRDMKPKPDKPESERAKWGKTHKCKRCGRNPYPNYQYCPPCHSYRSRFMSGIDEHAMPPVPISGIN